MPNYVALFWNPSDSGGAGRAQRILTRLRATTEEWRLVLNVSGSAAVVRGDVIVLPEERGVIFGCLFARGGAKAKPVTNLSPQTADQLAQSGGISLLREYWGNYVAVISRQFDFIVFRDCSGGVPSFRTRIDEVDIVFSDVRDLVLAGFDKFQIDWRYLATFLCDSSMQIRSSALTNVSELLAGDCTIFGGDRPKIANLWHPLPICSDPIERCADAKAALWEATALCIDALSSKQSRVVHLLSGGFDSSLVLGVLRRSLHAEQIMCVTRYGHLAAEDERRYARLAAAQAAVELIEYPLTFGDRSLGESTARLPPSTKPHLAQLSSALDAPFREEIVRRSGCTSLWTGQGGDQVFLKAHTPLGLVDYVQRHGIRRGLKSVVADTLRLTKMSIWEVLKATGTAEMRRLTRSQGTAAPVSIPSFVNAETLPSNVADFVRHPWEDSCTDAPLGKQLQIQMLSQLLNRHRPVLGLSYETEVHPLLSQPIVEASLRIPLHLLLRGGRARGLAREVFDNCIPQEILSRESKGSVTSFAAEALRDRAFLRSFLVDGNLARHQVIDRDAVCRTLADGRPMQLPELVPMLATLCAETWSRSWS